MELTSTATVQLPVDLDAASTGGADARACTMRSHRRRRSWRSSAPAPTRSASGSRWERVCRARPPTHAFSDLLTTMHRAPKPLLAVVDGRAIGGGMGSRAPATGSSPRSVRPSRCRSCCGDSCRRSSGRSSPIVWLRTSSGSGPSRRTRGRRQRRMRPVSIDALVAGTTTLDRAIERGARTLGRLDPEALRRLRAWARESRRHDLPDALQAAAPISPPRCCASRPCNADGKPSPQESRRGQADDRRRHRADHSRGSRFEQRARRGDGSSRCSEAFDIDRRQRRRAGRRAVG